MIKTLTDIIKKYFRRNKKYIFSKNILHEMNGVVLLKANDSIFDFNGEVVDEIKEYGKNLGYKIDKVIFLSSYDIEVDSSREYNLRMQGDSKIKIIEEDEKIIAIFCIGEFVSIKDIKYVK
ncbi:MAG TPA: hypothetical protein VMZ91_10930 [Candidatus Paceibacterota bacterium]|nr:hypothetical protein [Candidatus Paceibacterota bacterium]